VHSNYVARSLPGRDQQFTIVRTCTRSSFVTSVSAEVVQPYNFLLSDLPGSTDITNLFDMFRFKMVELIFIPRVNFSPDANIYSDPRMFSMVDFDGNAVASVTAIQEYDTCETHDVRRRFQVKLVPKPVASMFSGATAEAPNGMWIDVAAAATCTHFGVVVGMSAQPVVTQILVTARYTIECKRSR